MFNPFCHCYRARGLTFLKDLFFSAHVGEMRVHSAALNVHSSGFIMAEPPRNISVFRQKFLHPSVHDIFTELVRRGF